MKLLRLIIIGIVINTLAVFTTDYFMDTFQVLGGLTGYLVVGSFIGLTNTFLKPILRLLTLPIVLITGGLSMIILNALILYAVIVIIPTLGLSDVKVIISGPLNFVMVSVVLGIINSIEHWIFHLTHRTNT